MTDDLWRKKIEDYQERLASMTPRERFKEFIISQTYSHDTPHVFDPGAEDGWTEIPDDEYPAVVDEEIDTYRAEVLREAAERIRENWRGRFSAFVDKVGVKYAHFWARGAEQSADLIDPDTP